MAAVSLAIVDRDDIPIYCTEFPTKYHWREGGVLDEDLFGLEHLVDKDGEQVRRDETDFDCSLKQQFIVHSALDRFVQLAGPPPGFNWRAPGVMGVDACFLGLLCPVEDWRVYGYATTTKIKFVLAVEDDEMISFSDQQAVDERIKTLLAKIHKHYIEYTLNPFTSIGGVITSKSFHKKVEEDVEAFNRAH